jgi:hypothetical protein
MKVTAEVKTTTKELVDSLLSMNTNNRHVQKTVVAKYQRDIESGNWHLTNQGIGISESGVLIDGQHRLIAIQQAGYPKLQILVVSGISEHARMAVDQHAKRSMRDLLHFAFNTRVSSRAPSIANVILRASANWTGGGFTSAEIHDVVGEYMEEIDAILSIPLRGNFYPAPYLAAFVMAMKSGISKDTISEFMMQVELGENLTRDMPSFHLRNSLTLTRQKRGAVSAQKERFLKACKALVAFDAGDKMGVLRV